MDFSHTLCHEPTGLRHILQEFSELTVGADDFQNKTRKYVLESALLSSKNQMANETLYMSKLTSESFLTLVSGMRTFDNKVQTFMTCRLDRKLSLEVSLAFDRTSLSLISASQNFSPSTPPLSPSPTHTAGKG